MENSDDINIYVGNNTNGEILIIYILLFLSVKQEKKIYFVGGR